MFVNSVSARICAVKINSMNKANQLLINPSFSKKCCNRIDDGDVNVSSLERAKQELVKQAKYLSESHLTAGSGGNISMRYGDKILISAAGSMFSDLRPEDIAVVDRYGEALTDVKPSSETKIHAAIYNKRPDVNSVIHFHPVYATVYAVANKTMLPNILPHTTKHFSSIKVIPYKDAGTSELAKQVSNELGQSEAILLGNHGALVVGKTPKIAAKTADSLENYAKISYMLENSDFNIYHLSSKNVDYMLNQNNKR